MEEYIYMDEYDRGFYDALKWVYEHTGGDNYKLSVKDKMQEFIKEEYGIVDNKR